MAGASLAACIVRDTGGDGPDDGTPPGGVSPSDLPLIDASRFKYKGGFTLPADQFGESSLNFAEAVIEQSGNSLFVVGHVYDDSIAEFIIPELVDSTSISDLNSTGSPVQNFSSVLNRSQTGNSQSLDQIMGLEIYKGQLIVNADEYYDAPGDNTHTTLVVSDAGDIAGSTVKGYFKLASGVKSGGWITEVPPEWQSELNATHLVGNSAGTSIVSRHSVGPSAHFLNGDAFLAASTDSPNIGTSRLLEYSLENPLHADLYNESRENDVWTMTSKAKFGFIVPGTRTYATFGSSSGHVSGLGYKIVQDNGNLCGGPCSRVAADQSNFYWFFDMNDLLAVRDGLIQPHAVRPYAYGKFDVPFQRGYSDLREIGGGTYDAESNTLYLSVKDANNTLGQYDNPPVIAAFGFDP